MTTALHLPLIAATTWLVTDAVWLTAQRWLPRPTVQDEPAPPQIERRDAETLRAPRPVTPVRQPRPHRAHEDQRTRVRKARLS